MENTRMIMLEGLPGTGKSTNSFFLYRQLERMGKTVKWFHEVARPHPVLFFDEACLNYDEYKAIIKAYPRSEPVLNRVAVFRQNTIGIDLLELEWNHIDDIGMDAFQALRRFDVLMKFSLKKYADVAMEKWAYFTEKALGKNDEIYILDSSIFQYQIFTYLLKNAPYKEIEQFIQQLIKIIKPLNPHLVYFYREDTRDTVNFLENLRGTQFMENIWERDKTEPYYADKPKGAEGHKQFLMDYGDIAKRLFDMADCEKTSIEITSQDWATHENDLLSFLGMERKPYPNTLPPNGIYGNEAISCEIKIEGLYVQDPNGTKRSLTPKSETEFYVENLPVILRFVGAEKVVTAGGQICERWTTSETQFLRV